VRGPEKSRSASIKDAASRLDGESAPFPGALDSARAYLEFHMLGGLLVESAETRRA
jgi:hypothetical protein